MGLALTIEDKVFTAKGTFKFKRAADEKYGQYIEQNGQYTGGIEAVLQGLLSGDVEALLKFFDCGFEHYGKDRPTLEAIETALEERIEKDGDSEQLFKEVYQEIINSGFFKESVRMFWKNMQVFKTTGESDAEKAQNAKTVEYLEQRAADLVG